jgi:hypothetical protein
MPSIRDLFKEEVKGLTNGLYKKSKIYIESQGAINPPRLKALLLSSPSNVADLIALTAAAALGVTVGHANRPSDTIFGNPGPFAKPIIGLAGPLAQRNLRGLILPFKDYYTKQAPAPYQVINQIKNGISTNPLGTLLTAARNELRDGTIREIFAKRKNIDDKYGTQFQHVGTRSFPLLKDKKFTQYKPEYKKNSAVAAAEAIFPPGPGNKDTIVNGPGIFAREQAAVSERSPASKPTIFGRKSRWDLINDRVLEGAYLNPNTLLLDNAKVNIPYVAFEFYGKIGKDAHILLPGTISGLSEDITPTWNTYKYVGSPFNTYRYSGVERTIKFDLKLYAIGKESLKNLKSNLDKLRKSTFPNQKITQIKYGSSEVTNAYNPNLVYLTISGVYKKLLGFIDSLNFSIDDSTPWPTTDLEFDGVTETPHPAIINVSISMKIIEQVRVDEKQLNFKFTDEYTQNEK